MSRVVVFHHAHGLTPGVRAFADRLRAAGHTVTTPDLFGGITFDALEDGVAYARTVGFDIIGARGGRSVADLPTDLVYLGFSLGVLPAQQLAQIRPGARGAVLVAACFPPEEFAPGWPSGLPVQVHGAERDPEFADSGDLDAARELVASVPGAELFVYPGDRHLFADASLPAYDATAADLLTDRVIAFLARLDGAAAAEQ